jgi:hypothetical protein
MKTIKSKKEESKFNDQSYLSGSSFENLYFFFPD